MYFHSKGEDLFIHFQISLMELLLKRTYHAGGTNGELFQEGKKVCDTIELPWKDNQRKISCIPEKRYRLQKRYNARFGHHLLVMDVPDRTFILIHAFNNALEESKGCIAPVSQCTGEGKGIFSRVSLIKLTDLVYPELEKGNRVFLTIQS